MALLVEEDFREMVRVVVGVLTVRHLLMVLKVEILAAQHNVLAVLVVVVELMVTPVAVAVAVAIPVAVAEITEPAAEMVVVVDHTTVDPIKAMKVAFGTVTVRSSSKHVQAFVLKGSALQTITPTPMLPFLQAATAQATVQAR